MTGIWLRCMLLLIGSWHALTRRASKIRMFLYFKLGENSCDYWLITNMKKNNTKAIRLLIFHVFLSNCCVKFSRIFSRAFVSFSSMRLYVFQRPETFRLLYNYLSFELLAFSFKLWIKMLLLSPLPAILFRCASLFPFQPILFEGKHLHKIDKETV